MIIVNYPFPAATITKVRVKDLIGKKSALGPVAPVNKIRSLI